MVDDGLRDGDVSGQRRMHEVAGVVGGLEAARGHIHQRSVNVYQGDARREGIVAKPGVIRPDECPLVRAGRHGPKHRSNACGSQVGDDALGVAGERGDRHVLPRVVGADEHETARKQQHLFLFVDATAEVEAVISRRRDQERDRHGREDKPGEVHEASEVRHLAEALLERHDQEECE